MSYTPYPAYKDSGVPWLGQVPEGWDPKKIKYLVNYIGSGKTPRGGAEIYTDDGIMILRSQNVYDDGLRLKDVAYVTPEVEAQQINTRVQPADVLLNITGASIGRSTIVPGDLPAANVNQHVCIFRPQKTKIAPEFLHAFFCSSIGKEQVTSNENGTSREGLNFQQAGNLHLVLPPFEEQTAIADFLDEKTAEIDDLIAKKEELLRLLSEQRTALITHAVTKGLNPHAPMKPSGIDWLGDVPRGWDVKPLKYLGRFQNGISIGGDSFGSGFPFVSYGDVYKNLSLPETGNGLVESTVKDRVLYSVERGDIFFTRTSETIEEIAISSVCEATIPGAVFAGFLIRCRPYPTRLGIGFSKYYFRNSRLRDYFVKEMNLVTRASLGQTLLGNLMVALPPLDEQDRISAYLDEKLEDLTKVETDVRTSIRLLKEYRTSIITNAVTGKIKIA